MKDYIRSIAESIRRLREERGMTQEELAELAGISQSHLSKVEAGSRAIGMKTYVKLLNALGARRIAGTFYMYSKRRPGGRSGIFHGYYGGYEDQYR